MNFTDEDVKFLDQFGEFLLKNARMDLSIPDIIQMNKYLAQYNVVRKKVANNVMEVKRIINPPEPEAASEPEPSKPGKVKK